MWGQNYIIICFCHSSTLNCTCSPMGAKLEVTFFFHSKYRNVASHPELRDLITWYSPPVEAAWLLSPLGPLLSGLPPSPSLPWHQQAWVYYISLNIHTSAWIQFVLHTSPTWCSHLVPCVLVTSRFVPGQCCWTHLDISHLTWPWLQPGFLPPTLLISFGAFTALPAVEARNLGTILDSFLSPPPTSKPLDGISFHLSLQNIFWVFLFVCLSCFCFSTCNFMLEYHCVTVLW